MPARTDEPGSPLAERCVLLPATRAHVQAMMPWFPTLESCRLWGGQTFRFPFTAETFLADSRLSELASYAMMERAAQVLCGFGQFYLRAGRCHLARLAIAPTRRGEGCGTWLIGQLMTIGTRELGVGECSLYVNRSNTAAIALYERLGFAAAPHPEAGAEAAVSDYLVKETS